MIEVLRRPVDSALRPGVRVVDQLARLGGAFLAGTLPQRHPQRDHHQIGVLGGRGVPSHDPLGVNIDDERNIGEAGPRSDVDIPRE